MSSLQTLFGYFHVDTNDEYGKVTDAFNNQVWSTNIFNLLFLVLGLISIYIAFVRMIYYILFIKMLGLYLDWFAIKANLIGGTFSGLSIFLVLCGQQGHDPSTNLLLIKLFLSWLFFIHAVLFPLLSGIFFSFSTTICRYLWT